MNKNFICEKFNKYLWKDAEILDTNSLQGKGDRVNHLFDFCFLFFSSLFTDGYLWFYIFIWIY